MNQARKELILETEVMAELDRHPDGRCLNTDHQSWESTAVIEYPRRWWWGTKRVLIIVTSAGRIMRKKI